MASDRQQAILLLTSATQTCSAALASIIEHSRKLPSGTHQSDHAVLHKDLLSLLALIYAHVTKLSLTLKPPSPAYKASFGPLKDISDQISALSHCVRLFTPDHGVTLLREVVSVAQDVIQSVRALLQTFLENETHGVEHAGNEYLVRTGAAHDLITKARAPGGVSADNVASVGKRWKQDHDALEDGVSEIIEMINKAQAPNNPGEDIEDDGWNEIGIPSTQKMDEVELERTKKVHAILRLSNLLHKRILKKTLSPPTDSPLRSSSHVAQNLDTLLSHSSALLASADDLISTMYAPQNLSDVTTGLASYVEVIRRLRQDLHVLMQGDLLAEQFDRLNIDNHSTPSKDPRQWLNTCFDHIEKAAEALKAGTSA